MGFLNDNVEIEYNKVDENTLEGLRFEEIEDEYNCVLVSCDDENIEKVEIPAYIKKTGGKVYMATEDEWLNNDSSEAYKIVSIRFESCNNLTSIILPYTIETISDCAFLGCDNLISIEIPNSVTSIGELAFYDCSGLKSITIPNSVTSIGELAFYGCSGLKSITIPNSVTSIGLAAFLESDNLLEIRYDGTKEEWERIEDVDFIGINKNVKIEYYR